MLLKSLSMGVVFASRASTNQSDGAQYSLEVKYTGSFTYTVYDVDPAHCTPRYTS
jgi:hypothetical protein